MGLTYFLLDQSRKEAEYCMENAFNTYFVRMLFLSKIVNVFSGLILCPYNIYLKFLTYPPLDLNPWMVEGQPQPVN